MTTYRIAWLTPWNERSAIARSASQVAFELVRRGHVVTVFRTETGDAKHLDALPAPGHVFYLDECTDAEVAASSDVTVVHIGDNYDFHGAAVERLGSLNAVGIFHDAFLADLPVAMFKGEVGPLRKLVTQVYGASAWPAEQAYFHDLEAVMAERPMLEWLSIQTVAAVGHASHYAERLRKSCHGPVVTIPLAYEVDEAPPLPEQWSRLTVAVLGNANPNKRIDQLMIAIAASSTLRRRCRIKLIGPVTTEERERLTQLASAIGVPAPFFTGWVPEDDLMAQLRDVDVISCLRNPVLEGASASLIVALAAGRPTLVSDHGGYAELPDGIALKCPPGAEANAVLRHLEALVEQPGMGRAIGEEAKAYAVNRFTAAAYVDALELLLAKIANDTPKHSARRVLLESLTSLGLPADDPSVLRAKSALDSITTKRDKRHESNLTIDR